MSGHNTLINPGPVATPGSKSHRVGAPNHLQGSGENAMVGTHSTGEYTADPVTVAAVRTRLNGQSHRFLTAGKRGLSVSIADLAVLVAEIVAEFTDHVVVEREALAEDLAWELHAGGGLR